MVLEVYISGAIVCIHDFSYPSFRDLDEDRLDCGLTETHSSGNLSLHTSLGRNTTSPAQNITTILYIVVGGVNACQTTYMYTYVIHAQEGCYCYCCAALWIRRGTITVGIAVLCLTQHLSSKNGHC